MRRDVSGAGRALLSMQRMSWEQGMAAQAFFECGDVETGLLLVREALRRASSDGLPGVTNPAMDSVDCGSNGLPAYYAYLHTKEPRYLKAVRDLADWFEFSAPRSATGQLYHNPGIRRHMIDGIYHIVPVCLAAGRIDFAMRQIRLFHERHYAAASGLYRQFWDDDTHCFSRRALWGGGQGWMAAALSLACLLLPRENLQEMRYAAELLNGVIDSMRRHLRSDGMFHDVVDDPSTFPEVTASLMLCYAIYTGIRAGALSVERKALADTLLDCADRHVDPDGFIGDACASPTFDRPGNSAEAQAFYMLCHAARERVESDEERARGNQ